MVCEIKLGGFLDLVFNEENKAHPIDAIEGLHKKARVQTATGVPVAEIDPTRPAMTRVSVTAEMFKEFRLLKGKFYPEDGLMVATLTNRRRTLEMQVKHKKGREPKKFLLKVVHRQTLEAS
jgi:hypothetical protein